MAISSMQDQRRRCGVGLFPRCVIDHAIWATRDLDAAAARFEREYGLAAAGGGRHEGMGTHNRIVPLGGGYLELLAIADAEEAARRRRWARGDRRLARVGEGWMGWAVVVDDVDAVAERLGTEIDGDRARGLHRPPDRRGGGDGRAYAAVLPERGAGTPDPGEGAAAGGLAWVEVAGDAERLRDWLGGAGLPVRVQPGEPALLAVGIGERELR